MATDVKLAEVVAALPDGDQKAQWSRSYRDFTPEVEMLSAVFDRLGELISVVAASRGARGKSPATAPRPVSAVERVRRRLTEQKHKSLSTRIVKDP